MGMGLGICQAMLISLLVESYHTVHIPPILIQSLHPADHDVPAPVFPLCRELDNAVVLGIFSRRHSVIFHFQNIVG